MSLAVKQVALLYAVVIKLAGYPNKRGQNYRIVTYEVSGFIWIWECRLGNCSLKVSWAMFC